MLVTLLERMRYLPYRIVRRFGTADISRVFGVETDALQTPTATEGFYFAEVTETGVSKLVEAHPEFFNDTQGSQLATEGVYCFGAFQGQSLAGYAWIATGDIPAEFNHNGDLRAGLPVFLPPDTGFVYNVFVMPLHRGKRLYANLMGFLAEVMRPRGITRMILTTDATNTNSLNALRRMGFRDLGRACLFRLGPFSIAKYPPTPVFETVRFGKYTGDLRALSKGQ
ncbi:MAG: GNAT family N-acetyltransferase [Planctomycetota bacterium]